MGRLAESRPDSTCLVPLLSTTSEWAALSQARCASPMSSTKLLGIGIVVMAVKSFSADSLSRRSAGMSESAASSNCLASVSRWSWKTRPAGESQTFTTLALCWRSSAGMEPIRSNCCFQWLPASQRRSGSPCTQTSTTMSSQSMSEYFWRGSMSQRLLVGGGRGCAGAGGAEQPFDVSGVGVVAVLGGLVVVHDPLDALHGRVQLVGQVPVRRVGVQPVLVVLGPQLVAGGDQVAAEGGVVRFGTGEVAD